METPHSHSGGHEKLSLLFQCCEKEGSHQLLAGLGSSPHSVSDFSLLCAALERLVLPLPTVTLCDGATGSFGFIDRRLPQPPPPFIFLLLLAAVAVTARCEAP